MGHVLMSNKIPRLTEPHASILLSDIADGSIVKLNESGSPVEFYVAKHDYESALNGTGRTLLVRKFIHSSRMWDEDKTTNFSISDVCIWLNGEYKSKFDDTIQSAIGETKFYYTIGENDEYREDKTMTTVQKSIFLLSMKEHGLTSGYNTNPEGSTLPIASVLRVATMEDGTTMSQWTRTPSIPGGYGSPINVIYIDFSGGLKVYQTDIEVGVRPAFTLPSSAKFDAETLVFKKV